MMQMMLLEPQPVARRTDPVTSHRAAAKAASITPSHRNIILAALREHGELTVYGIEGVTGIAAHRVGKRMVELQRLGLAEPCGESDGCRIWKAL